MAGRAAPAKPVRRTVSAAVDDRTSMSASRVTDAALGGLKSLPEQCMWLVAKGDPVSQGSMRALAAGVIKHEKGPKLRAWRDIITREALRASGDQWVPIAGPVTVHVTLTVPAPRRISTTHVEALDAGSAPRCPPDKKPDVDKLLRAVQDALSPRDDKKKGEQVKTLARRFKLLVDDSLVIDSCASKTYPRPMHTHPWALPWPGAVIRV
ncbi:MAG: RusA family crossover junction endodeoxyribonuclease, partial [Tomitella sp.]|nr:RusA family crossover junction endodeoxyribonuclease [Tomitella sp.]